MSWKDRVTSVLLRIENAWDRAVPGRTTDRPVIEPYSGYSSPDGLVLRGRVLASLRRGRSGNGKLGNARQMLSYFATREIAGITVIVPETDERAVTDEEGYFVLKHVPRTGMGRGLTVPVAVEGVEGSRIDMPVYATDPRAEFGIISDIDDTMMFTGAESLVRNLWTTFTGNSQSRMVFEDAVEFIDRLHDGRNPVFYVSSSPWNLHHFLRQVFGRAGLVGGPMFLRDMGLDRNKLIAGSHFDHKGRSIDRIMAANPELKFVLIGDTGQHDAEVYLRASERHPGRVRRIVLRAPGRGADERDKEFATLAAARGVDVAIGRDYRSLIRINPGEHAEPDRSATGGPVPRAIDRTEAAAG